MIDNKSVIALIPARGGSKGLTRKNIKELHGKPLIAWTIQEALVSKYIDRVIVSSEDAEIIRISQSYGAEIPFIRPRELADDKTSGMEVVLHAIQWLKTNKISSDIIILLQPTSPLRQCTDIDEALESFIKNKANSIISVTPVDHHPYWSNTLPENLNMDSFLREDVINCNRQDLPQFYRLSGSLFISYSDLLLTTKSFFCKNSLAHIIPTERSIDIDSELDFEICKLLLEAKTSK